MVARFDKPKCRTDDESDNLAYGAAGQAVQCRADGHSIDAAHVVMPVVCVMVTVGGLV